MYVVVGTVAVGLVLVLDVRGCLRYAWLNRNVTPGQVVPLHQSQLTTAGAVRRWCERVQE